MKLRALSLRFVEIVSANYWQTLPHFCTELLMLSVFFRLGQNMTIVKVKREDQEGKERKKCAYAMKKGPLSTMSESGGNNSVFMTYILKQEGKRHKMSSCPPQVHKSQSQPGEKLWG